MFKSLKIIPIIDETRMSEITDPSLYNFIGKEVSIKVFTKTQLALKKEYYYPVRQDLEKGIIKFFQIEMRFINYSEIRKLLIILGLIGINRFNYTKYIRGDIVNIIESRDLLKLLDVGYTFGKYKLNVPTTISIVEDKYSGVIVYNVTIVSDVFIIIVNEVLQEFLMFQKSVESNIDTYLKYRLFGVPIKLSFNSRFVVKDILGNTYVEIYVDNGTLYVNDNIFNRKEQVLLSTGELSYEHMLSSSIETYTFLIKYEVENIIIEDTINSVIVYNTPSGSEITIEVTDKLRSLIEKRNYVKLETELFILIITKDNNISLEFKRAINVKKITI